MYRTLVSFPRIALLGALLAAAAPVWAQSSRATVAGAVFDPSGAVVPNAIVRVKDVVRGLSNERTTNEAGRFSVPNLVPSTYEVEVTAGGFTTRTIKDLVLRVDQQLDLSIRLEIGSSDQVMTVDAQAVALETANATMSQVVDNKQIANLPLNGRQSLGLITLVPNVRPGPTFDPNNFDGAGSFSVNGGRNNSSEILLDGSPAMAAGSGPGSAQTAAYKISLDAVQEFRVITNTLSAEYGNTGGGTVTVVSKSGTNSLHGSAYNYLRNSALDANTFFNNRSNIGLASFKRNQFGGTIGGPVVLPKLYDGRNRTFFFVAYEGLRSSTGTNLVRTVPTDLQRLGNFTQTRNAAGQVVSIYDPLSTRAAGAGYVRDLFPGNVVPTSRLDPVSQNLLKHWPAPNAPGAANTGVNNFIQGAASTTNSDQADYRVDHRFNDRHSIYGRYSHNRNLTEPPMPFGFSDPAFFRQFPTRQAVLDYTWVKSNATLINLHYGYSWLGDKNYRLSDGFDIGELGLNSGLTRDVQYKALSQINITNISQIGSGIKFESPYIIHQYSGSVSHVRGKHTLKIGADTRRYRYIGQVFDLPGGQFSFSPSYTQGANPLQASAGAGVAFASFLLGAGSGEARIQNDRDIRAPIIAGYVQDDWKVSQKLTLNLGLRYDLFIPRVDANDQLSWFDSYSINPLSTITGLNLRGGLRFAGQDGRRRQFDTDWNNFAPRVGLAYLITPKTAIRSGFGVMYPIPNTSITAGAGFDGYAAATRWVSAIDNLTPDSTLRDAFVTGLVQPTRGAEGLATLVGQSIAPKNPANTTSYNLQWNFTVQRELSGATVLELSYIGNRGVRLPMGPGMQINQLSREQLAFGSALLDRVDNPFSGVIQQGILSGPTTTRGQLMRPFPQFDLVRDDQPSRAQSIYHGFGVRFEKRFAQEYVLQASYTNAKLIDDSSETAGFTGPQQAPQDHYNMALERSLAGQDVAQRVVASFQAPLPFGRNRALFGSAGSVAQTIIGGWQVNGIMSFQSGIPLGLTAAVNTANQLGGGLRPNSTGQSARLDGRIQDRLDRFFDTSRFTQPAPFTFGNVARTLPDVRGPRVGNLDLSLFKNFALWEGFRLQFRAEAFNLTNTPVFALPGTAFGSANFGVINSQANLPRQIQLALRLDF